jgi:hypothetical protein
MTASKIDVPTSLHNLVDVIIDRAQTDRRGVFWAVPKEYKDRNGRQTEVSVAFGTPGILLGLIAYFKATGNEEVGMLAKKAWNWLATHEQARSFVPGFYLGTAGLWYADSACAEIFQEKPRFGTDSIISLLDAGLSQRAGNSAANLAGGLAGTMVGTLSALTRRQGNLRPLESCLSLLVERANLCRNGLFWDFYPHAVQPPLGFINGSAGVDYALALAKMHLRRSYAPVIEASIANANAQYGLKSKNWPDHENNDWLRTLGHDGLLELIDRADVLRASEEGVEGDTVGWADGCAGILVSRTAVAMAFPHSSLGETASLDMERACAKIAQTRLDGSPSLQYGGAGLLLSLCSVRPYLPSSLKAKLEKRIIEARDTIASISSADRTDDLTLFTGGSGLLYAALYSLFPESGHSVVCPIGLHDAGGVCENGDLKVFFKSRVPRITEFCRLEDVDNDLPALNLDGLRDAVEARASLQEPTAIIKAAKHEVDILVELDDIKSYRGHHLKSLRSASIYAERYGDGMDERLLLERWKMDPSIRILALDYNPYAREPADVTTGIVLVRQRGAQGIVERELSALGHALLAAFEQPTVAIKAVQQVITRVQTPNVTQRQLADLSLKVLRNFISSDFLIAAPQSLVATLLSTRGHREIYKMLFPNIRS